MLRPALRALLTAACVLLAPAVPAEAVRTDHVEAELVAERVALVPGAENWVALRLKPDPGWHTYWRNPGDSGIPTTLGWQVPEGFTAGDIVWPFPERHALGEVMNYGYGDQTLHLVALEVPKGTRAGTKVELKAEAKWLVCSDICIPGKADVALTLPVTDHAEADARWQKHFADARARLPQRVDWAARFGVDDKDFSLAVGSAEIQAAKQIEFFPYAKDLVTHSAEQRLARDGGDVRLSQSLSSFFLSAPPAVEGVLLLSIEGRQRAFEIAAHPGSVAPVTASTPARAPADVAAPAPGPGILLALLLALAGGVILNLMPCVFPVLSLKALAVLEAHDGRERPQALAYTAGVVLSFVAVAAVMLGLRAGGQAMGWGFQLQSPVFVAALAYLFFVMGLALSGAVEIGARFMGLGQSLTQSGGLGGSFFTGVLAALVASPCTAPFMGPALGYAVTQPAPIALLIFATLGFGLALPFLLMGLYPSLARWLPRPGAWMETFKQLMAFPLFLTSVWLLWVLGRQSGADAVAWISAGMILFAFAFWLKRFAAMGARVLRLIAFVGALALLAHPALRAGTPTAPVSSSAAEAYSEERLAQLRAEGRTIFVNFTADWCLTCKVNERAVLGREAVRRAFAEHRVAELIGDWTRPDPVITEALARFGRSGVPLYLVYAHGGEPQVLPQILTTDILVEALKKE